MRIRFRNPIVIEREKRLIPLDECGLPTRCIKVLTRDGYFYLNDLTNERNEFIANSRRNFGKREMDCVIRKRTEYGLA